MNPLAEEGKPLRVHRDFGHDMSGGRLIVAKGLRMDSLRQSTTGFAEAAGYEMNHVIDCHREDLTYVKPVSM